jgi:hypothetical protein
MLLLYRILDNSTWRIINLVIVSFNKNCNSYRPPQISARPLSLLLKVCVRYRLKRELNAKILLVGFKNMKNQLLIFNNFRYNKYLWHYRIWEFKSKGIQESSSKIFLMVNLFLKFSLQTISRYQSLSTIPVKILSLFLKYIRELATRN